MWKYGIELYNPCQLVQVWHNHASDFRKNQYNTILRGDIIFLCPPQLVFEEDHSVVFGMCSGKYGLEKPAYLNDTIAYELLMQTHQDHYV
jgi:hypothetical protein